MAWAIYEFFEYWIDVDHGEDLWLFVHGMCRGGARYKCDMSDTRRRKREKGKMNTRLILRFLSGSLPSKLENGEISEFFLCEKNMGC